MWSYFVSSSWSILISSNLAKMNSSLFPCLTMPLVMKHFMATGNANQTPVADLSDTDTYKYQLNVVYHQCWEHRQVLHWGQWSSGSTITLIIQYQLSMSITRLCEEIHHGWCCLQYSQEPEQGRNGRTCQKAGICQPARNYCKIHSVFRVDFNCCQFISFKTKQYILLF